MHPVVIFRSGCLIIIFQPFGKSVDPLRSSEDDPKTSLDQQISLLGEFLTHFDIYNLSVALKLKTLIQRKKEISSVAQLSPACFDF